jgi:hypothetical protein
MLALQIFESSFSFGGRKLSHACFVNFGSSFSFFK